VHIVLPCQIILKEWNNFKVPKLDASIVMTATIGLIPGENRQDR